MNSVNLIGRITKDIKLEKTKSDRSCVAMFIAINNGKDENGNDRPADFPKVYVYDKQAENVSKYCKKGSQVAIDGRIKTRSWDKEDGSKGYETYVVANRVQFLDSKPSESASLPEPDYTPSESTKEEDPFASFQDVMEFEDEVDVPW